MVYYILIKTTNNIPKIISSSPDKNQILESSFKRIEKFLQRPLSETERVSFYEELFFETLDSDPTTFIVESIKV